MIYLLISRIKVGYSQKLPYVLLINKSFYKRILYFLWTFGYIFGFCIYNTTSIKIYLKRTITSKNNTIRTFYALSKPGNRIYASKNILKRNFKWINNGLYLVSTNKGLLTHIEATLFSSGGEILFSIS